MELKLILSRLPQQNTLAYRRTIETNGAEKAASVVSLLLPVATNADIMAACGVTIARLHSLMDSLREFDVK